MRRGARRPLLGPIVFTLLVASIAAAWPPASARVPEPPSPASEVSPGPSSCRAIDPTWVELGLGLDRGRRPLAAGRVFSVSDGTLAVLVVVADVDRTGAAAGIDFLASIGVDAVVVGAAADAAIHRFRPPAREGAGLSAPDGAAITHVAFCYRTTETPPPALPPEEAPRATVVARATGEAAARATETAHDAAMATATAAIEAAVATADARGTELARAQATADARATELAVAQATIAARSTAEVAAASTATAETAGREAAFATSTALAGAARATADALSTSQVSLDATAAAAQTEAVAAQATAESLGTQRAEEAMTATAFAVPTATPTPDVPPEAAPVVLYRADAAAGFAGWSLPEGWAVTAVGLAADGSAAGAWAIPPFEAEGVADYAVEVEVRVVGQPGCERNFGIGARGTDRGYYAGGVEWRCEPMAALWAGQDRIADTPLDPGEEWHLYRLEVRGDAVRLLVDGALVLEATDDRYPAGGEVALWSNGVALEVRRFVVTEFPPRR